MPQRAWFWLHVYDSFTGITRCANLSKDSPKQKIILD